MKLNSDKKLILYGAGHYGRKFLNEIGMELVYGFGDSDPSLAGRIIEGKKILSLEEIKEIRDELIIFPSVSYYNQNKILQSLQESGLEKNIIYTPYYDKIKTDGPMYFGLNVKCEGNNYFGFNSYVENIEIGYASYIGQFTELQNAIIGKYTSIGPNVKIIRGQHPSHTFVSTHPAFYSINHSIGFTYVEDQKFEEFRYVTENFSIKIGNDVWIGDSVKIMEGVSVADGTIVAAGAVVVGDTEPYSIVGGVPAKVIRYRFDQDDILYLLRLKWWNKDKEWLKVNGEYFENIRELRKNNKDIM